MERRLLALHRRCLASLGINWGCEMRLPFRPPFRFEAVASFLGARAIAGIESFDGTRFLRNGIVIEASASHLRLTIPAELAHDRDSIALRARRTFDLDADPAVIDAHLGRDKLLRPLLKRRPGPRVPGAWEPLDVAVRAIVGQQISVRGATTIMNRLYASGRFDPAALAGMPARRMEAIRNLARAFADDPSILARGATLDATIDRLLALPGIGPWTAHYIAMRALGERDAFPHSDLGLRKAAAALGIDPAKLLDYAERWRPWRAYAAIVLWESLN